MTNEYIDHLKMLAIHGGEQGLRAQVELVKEEERDENGRWASSTAEHSAQASSHASDASNADNRGDAINAHLAAAAAHEAAAEAHYEAADEAETLREAIAHSAAAEAHEAAAEAHEELAAGMRGASAEDAEMLSEKADNATRRANK